MVLLVAFYTYGFDVDLNFHHFLLRFQFLELVRSELGWDFFFLGKKGLILHFELFLRLWDVRNSVDLGFGKFEIRN